jgi:hypothetical protein
MTPTKSNKRVRTQYRLHQTAALPLVVRTWQEVALECKRVSVAPPLPVSHSVRPHFTQ